MSERDEAADLLTCEYAMLEKSRDIWHLAQIGGHYIHALGSERERREKLEAALRRIQRLVRDENTPFDSAVGEIELITDKALTP